ncbi:GroES-like protein [Karstenula rhodostoma CBS 690.94]|uniref:GroES-like protein n=1 Tax=Karstenula rhodostoma CBS 690.94 TaxID=1392251 RepID=A0A9P4PZL2_9PLEO|nr:GroES-like protein [Karstenula rhodostoma CBS 690.94]
MKEAIVQPSIEVVEIIESPIPIPKDDEVVIKVVVAGSNPKDWKRPNWKNHAHNSGDDMAGIVHTTGSLVKTFKPGDRVAAYHHSGQPHGSFAEYAVAPEHMTFHIPSTLSFEEAATLPLASYTAALALYIDLQLPLPFTRSPRPEAPTKKGDALLIYGVASACGAFAAKFARLSGIYPIIGVAGRGAAFAETLVDYVVDYRNGEDELVASVDAILAKEGLPPKLPRVFDAISEKGSLEATLRLIDADGGVVSTLLPPKLFARDKEAFRYPEGVTAINTAAPVLFDVHKAFGLVWSRYMTVLLEERRVVGHPFEVVPGGLHGVLTGLRRLYEGRVSAVKLVYRIGETGELGVVRLDGEDKKVAAVSNVIAEFPFGGGEGN